MKTKTYRISKKFIAIIVCIALVLTLVPLAVLAGESPQTPVCSHEECIGLEQCGLAEPPIDESGQQPEGTIEATNMMVAGEVVETAEQPAPIVLSSFGEFEDRLEAQAGTPREKLALPETLLGYDGAGNEYELAVAWEGEYDAGTPGGYTLTAVLPEGYELAQDAAPPQVTVTVPAQAGAQAQNGFTTQAVTAGFTIAPSAAQELAGNEFIFTSTSEGTGETLSTYLWNFGDGSTSTAQNPTHSYAQAGSYIVTLTVTGLQGGTNSTSQTVTVHPPAPVAHGLQIFESGATLGDISITGTNITWYNAPTGDTQLPSSTPLTTTPTYYYAASSAGGVESSSRTPVQAYIVIDMIYISTLGDDDSGDGASTSPFATLGKALSVVQEGGVIALAGNYTGINAQPGFTLDDKSITINVQSYTLELNTTLTVDGNHTLSLAGGSGTGVLVENGGQATVEGDVTGATYAKFYDNSSPDRTFVQEDGQPDGYYMVYEDAAWAGYSIRVREGYGITATAGENGSIDPAGDVFAKKGKDQKFTITPNAGYQVADVLVDGASVGAAAEYTFPSVRASHTIEATFAPAYALRTLTHTDTGVTVSGHFMETAALEVAADRLHDAGDCTACDEIRAKKDAGGLLLLYDISASGHNGGGVTVRIPVGSEFNGKKLTVLHCYDGTLESSELAVTDGYVEGTFSGLSPYGVARLAEENTGSTTGGTTTSGSSGTRTGDESKLGMWIALVLMAGAGIAGVVVYRRRKARGNIG